MNKFFSSDHHFNHDKILQFSKSSRGHETLQEMEEDIIEKHNSVVGDNDIAWFGGDVIFGENPDFSVLHRMRGRKCLVLGNHDTPIKVRDYAKIFEKVMGSVDIKTKSGARYVFTHRPIHNWEMDVDKRYDFCIHGHLHGKLIDDPRYVNVCMEHINMTPISFEEIRSILRDRGFRNA